MTEAQARILIVDDEPFNRDVLEQELEGLGHTCLLAENGEQALACLASQPVDAVLLDIMMPGLNGFAVLGAVQDRPEWRDIPIIVISAVSDLQSIARGIEMGAVDYLSKPFDPLMLKARLDASLARRRWRAQEQAYLAEIERERRRADELLDVVLPRDAVLELKQTGHFAPRALDGVAVMFLDIIGFSEIARHRAPEDILAALTVFTERAEELAAEEGLEKLKLVGDAVMMTGNLLVRHPEPVAACVACSRRLLQASGSIGDGWSLRGGIALGPVIAGVIGRHRFGFDIWGHTVNVAARLAALPGQSVLHLDPAAAQALPPDAGAIPVGTQGLKGTGPVQVHRIDQTLL